MNNPFFNQIGQALNTMDLTKGLGLQAGPKPIDVNALLNRPGFKSADMTRDIGLQAAPSPVGGLVASGPAQKPQGLASMLGNPALMAGLSMLGSGTIGQDEFLKMLLDNMNQRGGQ